MSSYKEHLEQCLAQGKKSINVSIMITPFCLFHGVLFDPGYHSVMSSVSGSLKHYTEYINLY